MCGIAGIVNKNFNEVGVNEIKSMCDALAHRGPDGEGQWIENNVALGHRRLSIIDISNAGKQPMITSDERWVLSYNGEVYNHKDIRKDLENKGVKFKSNADSEVVLNALSIFGKSALLLFNGMFALALWDRKEKKLLLARDRYGIKPLYFSTKGENIIFASEQKAIITQRSFTKNINKKTLLEYFTFQNIFSNKTFFDDVNMLPAGHYLEFDGGNGFDSIIKKYWDYSFVEEFNNVDEDEYKEELNRLFRQSVRRQLIGDVEVGSYLSGGIDSGSISSIASREILNLKTFTCGFDLTSASGIELNFDERSKAEAMSAYFKTEHYQMVLKSGDMERCIPDLTRALEDPRVGQSYPNFYAAKLASRFVKVILSGVGGDELFGGYPWRYFDGANCKNKEEFISQYYSYWQRLVDNNELRKIFSPIWEDVSDVYTEDIFKNVFEYELSEIDTLEKCINHSLYFEAKTFLHGLFVVEDKLSMFFGLENRVPFMDNDLVDFAMKCPVNLKVKKIKNSFFIDENESLNKPEKYYKLTKDGKYIFRKAMENNIPANILNLKKQGFSAPDASWFRGESIDFVSTIIFNTNSNIYNFLDYRSVTKIIEQHINGKRNCRLFLWSLINFEYWIKTFL